MILRRLIVVAGLLAGLCAPAQAALSAKAGSFNITTQAAGNTVVVTGVGFLPKALVLWWSGRTESTDATGGATINGGFGFSDGTNDRVVGWLIVDAAANADTDRFGRADAIVLSGNHTTPSVDGRASLQTFDSDGFTALIDDAFPTDFRVSFLALGGSDLTNVSAFSWTTRITVGDDAVTAPGFQPDATVIAAGWHTAVPFAEVRARMSIGLVAGATPANAILAFDDRDNVATMVSTSYCRAGDAAARLTVGANPINMRGRISAWTATGFTFTWDEVDGAANIMFGLALKGGNYLVGDLLTQTNTTTDIVETGFGFAPTGALLLSASRAQSASDTSTSHNAGSIGAWNSTTSRSAQAWWDQDAVADSESATLIEHDEVYGNIDSADAMEGLMDIKSVESNGFTNIMDDADPAQSYVAYLAFGDAAAAAVRLRRPLLGVGR